MLENPPDSPLAAPSPAGAGPTDEQTPVFGDQAPSRFAADVEYSGRASHRDYLVRARHRLLGTTFTVTIDGVEHDPKAEEKAWSAHEADKTAESDGADGADETSEASESSKPDATTEAPPQSDDEAGEISEAAPQSDDDLRFTLADGFATLHCTVRRPSEDGGYKNAEVITIRTAGLGGAGEVDIRHGFQRTVLVPTDGSPSGDRDVKRTAHPSRYALIAALTKSARYLLPLLGFGALFSGLLDPLLEWIEARVRPAVEAVARMTAPIREWIAQLLRPIQEFLETVLTPTGEFVAAVLRPVRDLVAWLLGLLPDIDLPFDVPGWLVEVLVALIMVVAVFTATRRGLHERREKLAATSAAAGVDDPDVAADPSDSSSQSDSADSADPAEVPSRPGVPEASGDPTGPAPADQQSSRV